MTWISVEDELPIPGKYMVKVSRHDEVIEIEKIFMVSGQNSRWFGGCRPFADHDVVLAWKRPDDYSGICN